MERPRAITRRRRARLEACLVLIATGLPSAIVASVALADDSVVNSRHDLSRFGPGRVRAINESRVCIFCHTPHNANPAAPLWNRYNPRTHYRIYNSSTIDARIDQPGAASKLCLSCHDGSIALGLTVSREQPIPMTHPFIPTGPSDLTNDLSDDHPVGLRFDRLLSNRDPQLRTPDQVGRSIPLGDRGELECTACHDPHNNELGDFLRAPTRRGALCLTCHQLDGWRRSAHANSGRPVPATLTTGEPLAFTSLADNACGTCHVSHGAPQRERLLRGPTQDLCLGCHDGISGVDVRSAIGQRSGHGTRFARRDRHDPAEDPLSMPPHVNCVDCHNPHAAQASGAGTANVARQQGPARIETMEHVQGVSIQGSVIDKARFSYEVCFRCHADKPVPIDRRIVRDRDTFGNIRRQFQPSAASAHPIAIAASQSTVDNPSLLPGARTQGQMSCQDCHDNPDSRRFGGAAANGPHGSRFDNLLVARYETADFTIESANTFALCYRCHDRNSILADESFSLHRRHIIDGRSPCSACHTPHGVEGSPREHSHLINFDTAIVQGQRQFVDTGRFSGSCTLVCHGVQHDNFNYTR